MKLSSLVAVLLLIAGFSAQAATYKLDPVHSVIGFSTKHLVVSTVKGRFDKSEGSFDFDDKKMEVSKIDVKVDVNSIDTNEPKRDGHLKSPDFFDAAKYPDIHFKADKVVVKKDTPVKVSGTLTMRGVTKPVTLDLTYGGSVVDPMGNEKIGFTLGGKINRQDWGVSWNKTLDKGGVAVSDDVTIDIDGEAQKEVAKK